MLSPPIVNMKILYYENGSYLLVLLKMKTEYSTLIGFSLKCCLNFKEQLVCYYIYLLSLYGALSFLKLHFYFVSAIINMHLFYNTTALNDIFSGWFNS